MTVTRPNDRIVCTSIWQSLLKVIQPNSFTTTKVLPVNFQPPDLSESPWVTVFHKWYAIHALFALNFFRYLHECPAQVVLQVLKMQMFNLKKTGSKLAC